LPPVVFSTTGKELLQMTKTGENISGSRAAGVGLIVFILYVVVLALAAISELFDLGWFDHPIFK
jgi:hypothetical protein